MLVFGMDPQQALDAPRFLVGAGHKSMRGGVKLERGIPLHVAKQLTQRGHLVEGDVHGFGRSVFGRGQVIATRPFWLKNGGKDQMGGIRYWAGSDRRADGCAKGY